MNRRSFFTALATLPFVPNVLKRLGDMAPTFHCFGDMTAPPVIGYWVGKDWHFHSSVVDADGAIVREYTNGELDYEIHYE